MVALLLGFALAAASFIGSTLYADSRLELVARRSHDVSDRALPGIVQLGAIRRELGLAQGMLYAGAIGHPEDLQELPECARRLRDARTNYESLSASLLEAAAWGATAAKLDAVEGIGKTIVAEVESGQAQLAAEHIHDVLEPAARDADEEIAAIVRMNYAQGALAAAEADNAWRHTRKLGLALDGVSLALAAALAYVAYRSTHRYAGVLETRADELEMFAARVAHDVRSPLMPAVLALQRCAQDAGASEATRKTLERGLHSLERVDGLVQDLLSFARAGAEPEPGATASLERVMQEVVQDVEPQAAAAGVRVSVDAMPGCRVACAPGVLASIVHNLVCNAIKHMPVDVRDRAVCIRAACARCRALVEVADTGAGIPPELRAHVFEPYVRGDRSRPGLGLGLATVRRLVEAHHGAVGCRVQRAGGGTVFWFELPALPPAADEGGAGRVQVA